MSPASANTAPGGAAPGSAAPVNRYQQRIETLRGAMERAAVDAVLLAPSGDMQFITGLKRAPGEPTESHTFGDYLQGVLITPERVVTIVPYLRHLSVDPQLERLPWLAEDVVHLPDGVDDPEEGYRLFEKLGLQGGRLGLPKHALAMTVTKLGARYPGLRFMCTEELISPMRMVKDPEDLEAMRRASLVVDQALGKVVEHLHLGIREAEVYRELDWQMRLLGVEGTSFATSLMTGRPGVAGGFGGSSGHPLGDELAEGWVLAFDFGCVMEGWCSDFGRTVYFGEPTEDMRRAHYLVAEAQRRGMEAMRGGQVTAAEVDAAARQFLVEAGRGEEFIHRLGHGIGMDVHEHPFLCSSDHSVLREGMTFTVEPSLWVNHEYFVRVEDVVLVTPEGGRSLNVTPTFEMTVIA